MLYYLLLFGFAILPVVLLMIYIYRMDKYQKEPIKSLAKAFVGGMIAIPLDFVFVDIIAYFLGGTSFSGTHFFSAFFKAGIPEELSKFLIFMIFIWRDKNFDEYFDGIIYATFIGLGFACVENIGYVYQFGMGTAVVRALLSVPGHFLFGVVMGYFFSLAKFQPAKRGTYLLSGLLLAMLIHGLFDWPLMASKDLNSGIAIIIYVFFIIGDIYLWKLGLKYIRRQQENSRLQAEQCTPPVNDGLASTDSGDRPDYKHIDWNAGDTH